MGGAMSYEEKLFEAIDDLTNEIMDEIRVVLRKYEVHFPDWEQEFNPDLNLDDQIYSLIHDAIKDALGRK
jgi:hypothetical protein